LALKFELIRFNLEKSEKIIQPGKKIPQYRRIEVRKGILAEIH